MNNPESQKSHESSDSPNQWSSLAEEPSFEEHMTNMDDEESKYIDIENIDISTEQGKYNWLDALYHNARIKEEEELEHAIAEGEEDQITEAKSNLAETKMAQNLLINQIDYEDSLLTAIRKERDIAAEKWKNLGDNASYNAKEYADLKYSVLDNMAFILNQEIERREKHNS